MKLEIIDSYNVSSINIDEWVFLSEVAIVKNPFYEHWSLIPALKYLAKTSDTIKIVTIRNDKHQLIALFPIEIVKKFFFLSIVTFWKHNQCFLTTPLVSLNVQWDKIFIQLQSRLNAHIIQVINHDSIINIEKIPYYRVTKFRAAIFSLPRFNTSTSKRRKKEYNRIKKRIFIKNRGEYYSNIRENLELMMKVFIKTEASGWKWDYGSALLKNRPESQYYFAVIKNSKQTKKIIFSKIEINNIPIAISFGFMTGQNFYEIKTAYNHEYKYLHPGVVLELKNLEYLQKQNYQEIDSCTHSDNFLINRLWPDKKVIENTWVFKRIIFRYTFVLFYFVVKKIRSFKLD